MSHFFKPNTPFWNVNREWLTVLSGPRAVLLELAHPKIAQGVAAHSDYKHHPFKRLRNTLRTMNLLIYGTEAQAQIALRHYHKCHRRVHGELPDGTPYDAHDPFLRLWVLATLIDSALLGYDQFVQPLTLRDKESYYADCHTLATLLGLPSALMPATYLDFQAYMHAMLTSEELVVTDTARDIMHVIFAHPLIGRPTRWGSFIGIGLTPAPIRAAYGLEWDSAHDRWLQRFAGWSRALRPRLPSWLCGNWQAVRAEIVFAGGK